MQVSQIRNTNPYNSIDTAKQAYVLRAANKNLVTFNGIQDKSKFLEPARKFMVPFYKKNNKIKNFMAVGISKILETGVARKVIEKTCTSKKLAAHLTTLTSVVLTSSYMKKTLENEKLEKNKRRTLAINQGTVCGLSIALAYSINGALAKRIDKFTTKFLAINGKESLSTLAKYKDGIGTAAQIMIFMSIYRFIAPVFATPIANKIGNNIEAKHNQKKQVSR